MSHNVDVKTVKLTLRDDEILRLDGPATIKCEPASRNSRRMTYEVTAPETTRIVREGLTPRR